MISRERLYQGQRRAERLVRRWGFDHYPWEPDETKRLVGIFRQTRCPCSCLACGNDRNNFGMPTRQERSHAAAHMEDMLAAGQRFKSRDHRTPTGVDW